MVIFSGHARSQLSCLGKSTCVVAVLVALAANFLFASGHDQQRCVEIIALSIVAIAMALNASQGNLPRISRSACVLLSGFFVLGLISTTRALSLRHAVFEWSLLLLLVVTIFAIASELMQDGQRLPRLLRWVGIVCGLYSLKLIMMYAIALFSNFQVDMHSLAIGFSNARFLNHAQTALLPVIVLLCLQAPQKSGWRKAMFMLAAFWWSLLFACEARASVIALAVGCVVAVAVRRRHARQFLAIMGWSALTGMVLYAVLFILWPVLMGLQPLSVPLNVVERTAANPTSLRNLLWKLALELIAAHPWIGVGPHHFAHEGFTLYIAAHPHNAILQIAAEWGIPALLCLIVTLCIGGRALARSGARIAEGDIKNQQILVALLTSCAAICMDSLLSGVIVMPQSQLSIVLVLGITYAWVRLQGNVVQIEPTVWRATPRMILTAAVAVGLCGLLWSVAPDIAARARGDALTPAALARNPAAHWPRMWEAGYF